MALLRSQESRIVPGRRQKWAENARKVKDIVDRHGANIRVLQATLGAVPGTVVTGSIIDDWESLAARTAAINDDQDFQALMQEQTNDPDAPYAEPVRLELYEDLNEALGGTLEPQENATVYSVQRGSIVPGRRTEAIELLKQIREAQEAEGRVVASVWQVVEGEANQLLQVRAFENLAALAAARSQGPLASVLEIFQRARADAAFPYTQRIDSRILTDITAQL